MDKEYENNGTQSILISHMLMELYNEFGAISEITYFILEDCANKWYEDESLLPYLKEFINSLPQNLRILDLCCGAGYESMRMHRLGANVTGLDFSEESIRIAKERNPDIQFIIEDMLDDYSYLGKFDFDREVSIDNESQWKYYIFKKSTPIIC